MRLYKFFLFGIFLVFISNPIHAQCDNMIDIRCSPEGDSWQKQSRSVALMIDEDGNILCTGTLLNNVSFDGTPYFLTDEHCFTDPTYVPGASFNWTFRWNFEHTACMSGQVDQYFETVGMTIIAKNVPLDFMLLELDLSALDGTGYEPYFSGWDATDYGFENHPHTSGAFINHSSGKPKKITLVQTINDHNGDCPSPVNMLATDGDWWHVKYGGASGNNGINCMYFGASGSALYNQNKHVIGNLKDCLGGGIQSPNVTKFSASWVGGGETMITKRLDHWLNPDNLEITKIDGYSPGDCNLTVVLTKDCGKVLDKDVGFYGYACWLTPTVYNGQGTINYSWSDGSTDPVQRYSCGEQTFTLTVTDDSGCEASATGTMNGVGDCLFSPPVQVEVFPTLFGNNETMNLVITQNDTNNTYGTPLKVIISSLTGAIQLTEDITLTDNQEEVFTINVSTENTGLHFLNIKNNDQIIHSEIITIQ